MDSGSTPQRDVLDHPLYRIAHLHGNRWVTLKPQDQHSPHADSAPDWKDGTVYRCIECEEYVVIAPN